MAIRKHNQYELLSKSGRYLNITVPDSKLSRVVCPDCRGEGTELGHGLKGVEFSSDDFQEDEDFLNNMMDGSFDVPCRFCSGRGVVDVPDEVIIREKYPHIYKAIERAEQEEAAEWYESEMERRMGC